MPKMLQELLSLLPGAVVSGPAQIAISSITADSRQAGPGALFICLPGHRVDGHDYICQAADAGAAAVLVERDVSIPAGLTAVRVADTRQAMQTLAPYFYDYPGRQLRLIGVTGTNGKTTTTHLIRDILTTAGLKTGLIGTIHVMIGDESLPVANTTPDVLDLQSLLDRMRTSGVTHVIMEVSSHALELNRTVGCEFDTAVFTNLTQDHLDFHGTLDNYLRAKAKLFRQLGGSGAVKSGKHAVINIDDTAAPALTDACAVPVITYGTNSGDIRADDIAVKAGGASFTVTCPQGVFPLSLKITGLFNVYNTLAAIGAALAEGVDVATIKEALENFTTVAGRFELVDAGQPYAVIVDYAHTPDGLENILRTARQFAEGRIIVVFGCGGDRDRTKRPIMGRLAAELGDIVLATSDNPRTEDPAAILADIETGIRAGLAHGKTYEVIPDRRQAISRAIGMATDRDIVIIAGKGHETYQILKDKTIAFDDRDVARAMIKERR